MVAPRKIAEGNVSAIDLGATSPFAYNNHDLSGG
jgi:hypothetical protein